MATYTTADAIAAYLGVTFTPEQAAQATAVAEAITQFVDTYTGRTWQTASPIVGELVDVWPSADGRYGWYGVAFLRHAPATSVTSVSLRSGYPDADVSPLAADQWELYAPPSGELRLVASPWYGEPKLAAVVDYAYGDVAPADIRLAATLLGAAQMGRLLAVQQANAALAAAPPSLKGVKSLSVGQNDVSVTLAEPGTADAGVGAGSSWIAPDSATRAILDGYRRVVIA